MSTIERLQALVAAGTLTEWSSQLLPVKVQKRMFLVTDAVKEVLDADPWPALFLERRGTTTERRVRTHTLINQFVEGQNLTVGAGKDDADLKCLSPMERVPSWRVVEFRASHGNRLTRVLGEFAAQDSFVALKVLPRRLIRDWNKVAGSVDAEWLRLFPGEPPLIWNAAPKANDLGSNFSDF